MSGFDFQPFPANCGSLSVSENALCSAVFEFVENNATIYTSQRSYIEKSLMKKIKQEKFNAIKACKAFENMLIRHKKYIVEELNKNVQFRNKYNLTTKKLNKDIRRHISCLFVNNFLSDYEQDIKKTLGIKDDSDDNSTEYDGNSDICSDCDEIMPENCNCEDKEIVIETDKIFIGISRCGGCENSLNKCTCYENLCDKCDFKLKNCKCDELPEEENFESMYRKELFFHNETKEELKGASEIIKSYGKEIKMLNDVIKSNNKEAERHSEEARADRESYEETINEQEQEKEKLENELKEKHELIKKLMEHTQKMTLENVQLKDEVSELKNKSKNIQVLEIENKMMKRMISKRQKGLLEVHLKEELEREAHHKKVMEGLDNGTFFFPKKKDITI